MKALSLIQPWATLLATGRKTIETRPMRTSHRGITAIHASKTMPCKPGEELQVGQYFVQLRGKELWMAWTERGRVHDRRLWQGCVLGYGNLVGCEPVEQAWQAALDTGQFELGDYTPGRFAWFFTGLGQLNPPLLCSGALGLWELPEKATALVEGCVRIEAGTGTR